MTAGKRVFWTDQEDEKLLQLCNSRLVPGVNGLPGLNKQAWADVAAQFPDRTLASCKNRFWNRAERAAPKRSYKERVSPKNHFVESHSGLQRPVHLPEPSSLTAYLLGDPLPGRSALDKKREGLSA